MLARPLLYIGVTVFALLHYNGFFGSLVRRVLRGELRLSPSLQSLSRISKVSPIPSQSQYAQLPYCSARTALANRPSCRPCTISARYLNTAGQTRIVHTLVAMPSTWAAFRL